MAFSIALVLVPKCFFARRSRSRVASSVRRTNEFMNNQQIAEKFGISDDTVLNAQNDGELPYCLFGRANSTRKTRRSPKRAVLAWAAARLVYR